MPDISKLYFSCNNYLKLVIIFDIVKVVIIVLNIDKHKYIIYTIGINK